MNDGIRTNSEDEVTEKWFEELLNNAPSQKEREDMIEMEGLVKAVFRRGYHYRSEELAKKDRIISELKKLYFYARKSSWGDEFSLYARIKDEDLEETDEEALIWHGGKLAREVQKNVERMEGEK